MLNIDIIIKAITLLHRERELGEEATDNSNDLVRTILDTMGESKLYSGGDSEVLDNLKHMIRDMVNNPNNYDKTTLLQSLELIIQDKPNLLKVIDKTINVELAVPSLKRTIISLRNTLNNYYKEQKIKTLLSTASYKITTGNLGNESIQEFANKLMTNLEALSNTTTTKDPGIVDEIDIGNSDDMNILLNKVKEQSGENGRLKTGWKELNDMLGGGLRRGETVITSALQHNYKSGFVQSLFMQIPIHNVPVMTDPSKKPLILLISFEDDAEIIANFMYRYLYFNEHNEIPDLTSITNSEVAKYIKEKLGVNGYHAKIIRVNPSEWTYKHMFNKILEYEAAGFEIHATIVDYLSKLPTTGCITSGPMGTDLRDLWNRCRNFFSSKGILFVSPHQLSVDAKQLLRNGVSAQTLVKEIANKGYYEGSRQLDQVVDLEIHQHIAYINKKPFLTFQRGKRRFPEIIDENKKYFMLPFPHKAPIKENINSDEPSITNASSDDTSNFDF